VSKLATIRPLAVALGVLLVIACSGCSSGSSHDPPTRAQTIDYSATSAYLRARETLLRSSMADLPAGRGPMAAFVAHVGGECPGALRGTPLENQIVPRHPSVADELALFENGNLTTEIEQGLEGAQQVRQAAAVARFDATVASIRWSDPRITYLIKTFIEIEQQHRHMAQRGVCRDIREWVASGYHKVSPSASDELPVAIERRWTRAVAALGCGKFSPATPTVVLRALQLYQQPGAHPTTRDIEVMEFQLSFEESDARGGAVRSLQQALGISPSVNKPLRRRKHPRLSPHVLALHAPPGIPQRCSGKPDYLSEPVKEPTDVRTIER
jgi:hypothetical protein